MIKLTPFHIDKNRNEYYWISNSIDYEILLSIAKDDHYEFGNYVDGKIMAIIKRRNNV